MKNGVRFELFTEVTMKNGASIRVTRIGELSQ
jgi:hypothetical protein